MRILIVNSAEKEISRFTVPIEDILKRRAIQCGVIQYSDLLKTDVDTYDGIVVSASPHGNDIVEPHQKYYRWVKSSAVPLFGICAGHQIIGRLFRANLIRGKEKEIGSHYVEIDRQDPVFRGYENRFLVEQAHNDSITLPDDFVLLAHSEKCRVQVMRHKSRPIYTTQFHAEISNEELILNFIDSAVS